MDQTWTTENGPSPSAACDAVPAMSAAKAWTPERLRELAEVYLRAVAIGAPAEALAAALALGAVESAGLRLAADVLRGGPHMLVRATELASKILGTDVELHGADAAEGEHV